MQLSVSSSNAWLPKWPQMIVTGEPVTVEQAKEIIRRTDRAFTFPGGGNNRKYLKWFRDTVRMPEDWQELGLFQEKWGVIETQYVHNNWISSSYVLGPHGWCHPNGKIGFVDNIGKHPSVQDVLDDWNLLAKEFPFLKLAITLMSGEFCGEDIYPVVSIVVSDGQAVQVPADLTLHAAHPPATRGNVFDIVGSEMRFVLEDAEQDIPDEWVVEWGKLKLELPFT